MADNVAETTVHRTDDLRKRHPGQQSETYRRKYQGQERMKLELRRGHHDESYSQYQKYYEHVLYK